MEDLYTHLNVQKNDFFQNILYGITYLQEEQERRLNNPSEEHRFVLLEVALACVEQFNIFELFSSSLYLLSDGLM